ncbi:Spx/MgsR family RNA polymerase-binding regulatory protein [Lactiplantibacillus plantarum]|uniref:Spx/MgsR family RNA polymerase-binding regulatory protein n=2 Tax=Lactiplantibacillus plantarum TaxID=1590 RepID=UPI000AF94AFA|nr:Spx/MgsR family RNA polymerase-binding regulatory protein [Lactiplantibacillus plantarum]UQK34009.1 Spx/MgsR family RNA polymerase-binding regulatory protein [Lactiplantibacillus plantarum]
MINLCVLPSTASCRKAHRWLLEHRIPFHERNMNAQPLTETEIKHLLQYTYNGIDDLISTKSNAYHQLSKTTPIEDMPLSEAVRVLSKHRNYCGGQLFLTITDFCAALTKMRFGCLFHVNSAYSRCKQCQNIRWLKMIGL